MKFLHVVTMCSTRTILGNEITFQLLPIMTPCTLSSLQYDTLQEGPDDPDVDSAAGYAVQELSSRSNSLVPFSLKRVVAATKTHGAGLETPAGGGTGSPREGVTHHLKLIVSRGGQSDEEYEVDVGEASHGFVMRGIRGPL
jgi:hypothetical protein